MTGRITQLGISRWTKEGASYRTVHRFFHIKIDWPALQGSFFDKKPAKKTQATRLRGRPKDSKNKNKADVILNPEFTRILDQGQKVKERLKDKIKLAYFVIDAHFGNHPATQMVGLLDLHIISKMRYNAALWLEATLEQKSLHPRLKYGNKLDYANLPAHLLCSEETQDGYCTQMYQAFCWHKDFACRINVVIAVRTHVGSGRVGHIVLFSSDLSLSAECWLDYYRLRFQIEFTFWDAKQHFGLEDFMGVKETSVANGIGLSFFLVNLTTYLLEEVSRLGCIHERSAAVAERKMAA